MLAEATRDGPGPLAFAAVDVLLQLLLYHQRMQAIGKHCPVGAALLLTLLNGPSLLADIGKTALKQGAQAPDSARIL